MRKIVITGIVIAIVGSFLATLVFLYVRSQGDTEDVNIEQPEVLDIVQKTVATGTISPRHEIEIKPRVSGIIEEIFVEAGQDIEKGALVAKIRIVPDVVRLNDAQAAVRAARINFENAKQELARYEKLRAVVSETEYNQQLVSFQLRQQEVDAAESRVQLVREGASAKSGQASNLVHSTVMGMVLHVPVKEGATVIESNAFNAGTTIATIADMKDMIFSGWVDEADVGKVREGMGLDIRVGALDDEPFKGELEHIAPKASKNDGAIQFEVRAAVAQQNGAFLRAGYSANADIVLERRHQVLAINERVLQFENGEDNKNGNGENRKVYVELQTGPEAWEKRYIEVGLSDGIHIEVLSGLDKDAKIRVPAS
ncbi:efflux RND transporter periplasmic adaptor subunit [Myxococcota bacterium]